MFIRVTVTPRPIFLLLLGLDLAEIPMRVSVRLHRPLVKVDTFVVIPDVIIGVGRVIDSISDTNAGGAASNYYRRAETEEQ